MNEIPDKPKITAYQEGMTIQDLINYLIQIDPKKWDGEIWCIKADGTSNQVKTITPVNRREDSEDVGLLC
jgi:hypothetical protein